MKKKYKIVNKFRFITFVTVMLLFVSFLSVGIFGTISAEAKEPEKFIEIEVCYGDTVWQLAKTYGNSNKDIREVVYDICQLNNINAEDLYAGQTLLIPVK